VGLSDTLKLRRRWRNDSGNQRIYPLRQLAPSDLAELQQAVREAEEEKLTIRAVGSGHSWSDVALTDGVLVRPDRMRAALPLEEELLRIDVDAELEQEGVTLVRVQAGMHISELNAHLDRLGLALPNMGGFDGQTIAGVISTSTHGSGISFGPLSDLVRSLDVVACGGVLHRIEPSSGPTDAAVYAERYPERRIVQDDDFFDAAVVGVGCMGVIYAVTLAVRRRFYLREVRTMSTWSRVREQLASGAVLKDNAHYEVYFNPYPREDGEVECLVTTRNEVPVAEYRHDRRRSRSLVMELIARFPPTPLLIDLVVRIWPQISPFLIGRALRALVNEDYVNVSYRVFNIGAANYLPAYSAEIGVPVDERHLHLAAVDRIVEVAGLRRRLGDIYHSSPISLRFVKRSSAHLSMMHGHETMMIELIMSAHTVGGMELLAAHEEALYRLGGRPHWGQVNSLTGSHGLVETMYPRYADWQIVHAQLNASGVFDSPFSKRVGISRSHFGA
jgi:FAD/FMN-containing dehydrogenase